MPTLAMAENVLRTSGYERYRIVGRFRTNGASDPTIVYTPGWTPVSLTHNATGGYLLILPAGMISAIVLTSASTLTSPARRCVSMEGHMQCGTANPGRVAFGQASVLANGQCQIQIFTFDNTNALADIASDGNNSVSFAFEVEELR